jgi:predicted nucleic acid-binding protein
VALRVALDTNRYTDLARGVPKVEQTTRHYATVYRQLRGQGTPIPTNDLWITALVLQHELVLCDRDAHFDNLPQITRI